MSPEGFDRLYIYVSEDLEKGSKHFIARLEDPTTSYWLTFTKETEVNRWLAQCDRTSLILLFTVPQL
jgi:hypothetical protein